jgi:hypothetical protein
MLQYFYDPDATIIYNILFKFGFWFSLWFVGCVFYRFFQGARYIARYREQKETEKQLEAARGFYK